MDGYDAQPGRKPPLVPELSEAQRHAHELDLNVGLGGLAGIVAGASDIDEILGQIAQFAVQAIPKSGGASVALIHPAEAGTCAVDARIQVWSVAEEFVGTIETLQYEKLSEGPCITCVQSGRAVVSGSLGSDSRWPHFGGTVARMGVHSVLALPLIIADRVIGAINSYAHERDAFGEYAVQMGSQFAGPAAVAVYNTQLLASTRQRTTQLQRALQSRAVIDQAIGIIRSRSGGTAQEAFDRLTHISQREHVKLADVAEHLVDEAVRRARSRQ